MKVVSQDYFWILIESLPMPGPKLHFSLEYLKTNSKLEWILVRYHTCCPGFLGTWLSRSNCFIQSRSRNWSATGRKSVFRSQRFSRQSRHGRNWLSCSSPKCGRAHGCSCPFNSCITGLVFTIQPFEAFFRRCRIWRIRGGDSRNYSDDLEFSMTS